MNKLQKVIRALKDILRQPSLLNLIVERNENWENQVASKYPKYKKGLPIVPITSILGNEIDVFPYAFLDGGSLPTDLGLLKAFAKKEEVKSYFEIGTWRGESIANVSPYLEDCQTLNLSKEELKSMGLSDEYINMHRYYSKDLKNVTHLEGNSLNYDFGGLNKKFDLIFIDGDHHYSGVKNDTEKVFKNLIHKNTVVVWHDYAYNPEHVRGEVFLGILDGIPEQFRKSLYHVSNSLCAVYLPNLDQSISLFEMDYPQTPERGFKINIKIED